MSYGLQGFTEDGKLLYTTAAKCLHFIGTASYLSPSTGDRTSSLYTITSSSRPLVFAAIPLNTTFALYGMTKSGGTWTIEVAGSAAGNCTLYCFAELTTEAPLEGYGLRTFVESGEVAFDSTRHPLWLSEMFIFDSAGTAGSSTVAASTATYSTTYTVPAVFAPMAGFARTTSGGVTGTATSLFVLGIKRTAYGHALQWIQIYQANGGAGLPSDPYPMHAAHLVIEANGLT